jgi:DNA-binding transcriptional MerR regulator
VTPAEAHPDGTPLMRIGELGRRVGVKPDRLRAWEQRYDLLHPVRTAGGFRLYTPDDERRVRAMLEHLAAGVSASEAARVVRWHVQPDAEAFATTQAAEQHLRGALERLEGAAAESILDRLFAAHGVEDTVRDVILPCLRNIGDAWQCGSLDVAQEHFASEIIQRRLTALQQQGDEPQAGASALLACPAGERHVLGLIALGVGLRRRGWRVTYLGADTPLHELQRTARLVGTDVIVLAQTLPHRLTSDDDELRRLSDHHRVIMAGPGATEAGAARVSATYLDGDPMAAAATLSAMDLPARARQLRRAPSPGSPPR